MKKNLLALVLASAFAAGCATTDSSPGTATSPEALAAAEAAFRQIDWGFLQTYIGRQYSNDDGDLLRVTTAPAQGALHLSLYSVNDLRDSDRIGLVVRPTPSPDIFHLRIEKSGLFSDDQATVRFDDQGRMQVLSGSLNDLQLTLADDKAHFSYRASASAFRMTPKPLRRSLYTLNDGSVLPVSLDPDSPYQRLRAAGPFGTWEQVVGQTFVGQTILLKMEKDEAGQLAFVFMQLEETRPGRDVFSPPSGADPGAIGVVSLPNHPAGSFSTRQLMRNADDRIVHHYDTQGGTSRQHYINEGNAIRLISWDQRGDSDTARNNLYLPVTRERLAAAMENRERKKIEGERNRLYEEREAAERTQRSQATTDAILRGLASGFNQANQNNTRMEQQSLDFERNLNQKLQQIEQQKQQREREASVRADRIMAANTAAAQARTATPSAPSGIQGAQRKQEELRRQEEQRRDEEIRAAEQARLAREQQRAEEIRKKEELARQEKERQAQALQDHLSAERRAIRLQAMKCPAKGGLPSVIGIRPKVLPKVANCITVHFEARCPAERPGTGMTGSIWAYNGWGNCTESGDLPRQFACDVKDAVVEVTNVTTCQ
ncbi:hypothetical protein [Solimonas sp. SE-A11]|uniref:hypothetical protein n=1 Tax=Solimonas sp. SE-A11 TaxID=3054954 RepID=UPI00259CAB76|nr:hypothetical protein [Solimonas sp. SE-A11]MDM4772534.1 hypothetical protein [Solimonas sp. SE-A11]